MVSSALRRPDSTSLFHHYIGNDIKHSLPVEGGSFSIVLHPNARTYIK